MNRTLMAAMLGIGALTLGGCATYDPYYGYNRPYPVYEAPAPVARVPGPMYAQNVEYGVVERIDMYRAGSSSPVGVGTILGGLAGGLLGHQIGSGSGNTAATIAGAVGGAVVGNQIERNTAVDRYRIVVRLDNGGTVAVSDAAGDLRVGDRVRLVDGRVWRM